MLLRKYLINIQYAPSGILDQNPMDLDNLTDMWSFGVLVYALCFGKLPFMHKFEPRSKLMIIDVDYDFEILRRECECKWLQDIVRGCLTKDRNARFNVGDISKPLN
ncbi:hypothetical protein CANARDRAFT_9965 [[Candida] arabinofermentans NRRL YB-2248]|uniref:Protein kinase domain-containing protein n=1 Tax=[Candida] arabinofermentans NRRL YB-2248 TaxID=983967 RepID=A0A1E4SU03_9ASCO|nr:hypothetical protein CANARDRAFT_9965 [[Candida] arabinofermentans NRRL YB-2248]